MLYRKKLFFAVGFVSAGILTYPAAAAPTVKRLGATNTGNIQNSNMTASSKAPSTVQRASSVRTSGSYVEPKTNATSDATVPVANTSTVGAANSMRLSGIHGNIVKTIGSKISQNQPKPSSGSNTAPSDLTDRVVALEEQMASLPEKVAEIEQKVGDLDVANYYTIAQTEEYLRQNYYTKQYVDKIISQLPTAKIANNFDPSFLHAGQGNSGQGQP